MSISVLVQIVGQTVWLCFFQLLFSVQSFHVHGSGGPSDKVIFEPPTLAEERIVQDIIFLHSGVLVDFSYNETIDSTAQVSAPGCPKSNEGRPWLYYGSPPKCYLVGFQGPCSFGRRFYSVDNSKYGICNCDCFAVPSDPTPSPSTPTDIDIHQNLILPRRTSRTRMMSVLTMGAGSRKVAYQYPSVPKLRTDMEEAPTRYNFCHSPSLKRQVVYDGLRQECFPVLDQGPCLNGQWLIRDLEKENGITCEKRKCPEFISYNDTEVGGGFTYFDYRAQTCLAEVYGSLQESFFVNAMGILSSRQSFCRDAGMKYSTRLKTCVKDVSSSFDFNVLG